MLLPGHVRHQHVPVFLPVGDSGLAQLSSSHPAQPGTGTAVAPKPAQGAGVCPQMCLLHALSLLRCA